MITIIHGEDTLSSRNYLNELKLSFIRFDAVEGNIDEVVQVLEGSTLFASEQNLLVENLFSRKAKNLEQIIELSNKSLIGIYLYDSKEVTRSNLSKFPKAKVNLFKFPQTLFSFLDAIYPGNLQLIPLFRNALQTTDVEILMFMIVRQFRLMVGLLSRAKIEEVTRLAPWQRSKLERQAQLFGLENLGEVYKQIYELDLRSKSGRLPMPLIDSIDIWLLNL